MFVSISRHGDKYVNVEQVVRAERVSASGTVTVYLSNGETLKLYGKDGHALFAAVQERVRVEAPVKVEVNANGTRREHWGPLRTALNMSGTRGRHE